jgi:hypothetical protein
MKLEENELLMLTISLVQHSDDPGVGCNQLPDVDKCFKLTFVTAGDVRF